MSRSARNILDRVKSWPPEDMEELADTAREIEARRTGVYEVTPEEENAIREGLAELERGEWTSEESMRAEIGESRAGVTNSHRPCLDHTARTCSSLANSPRSAAALERVMASRSSDDNGTDVSIGAAGELKHNAGNIVLNVGGKIAHRAERSIEKLCHGTEYTPVC